MSAMRAHGVRLSEAELAALDRIQARQGLRDMSETVRFCIHAVDNLAPMVRVKSQTVKQ